MPRKAKDKENEIQEKTATKKRDTARRAPTNVAKTSTAAKKKAPAKKTTTKKATTKKTATKETSTKKVSTKKAVVEETATKKASIKKAPAKKSTTSKKSSLEAEKNIKTTSAKKTTKKETVPTEKKSTTRRATTKATTAATKKATATNKTTTKKNNGTVASTERRGRRSLQSILENDVLEKAKKTNTNKETAQKKSTAKKTATKKKATTRRVSTKKNKVEENLEYYDLPYRYNETTVKILAQTPKKLFIYWDISDDDRKNYVEKFGTEFFNNTVPVLIVHNDSQNYTFEVEINDFANCWYLDINDAKCEYTIELGRRSKLKSYSIPNNYIYVTSSNVIESPNDHILFEKQAKTVYFRNVKTNATHSKDIANISFIRNMGKIYNIYDAYKKLYGKMYSDEDMLNNPTSIFK